jgi:hypothetical protein
MLGKIAAGSSLRRDGDSNIREDEGRSYSWLKQMDRSQVKIFCEIASQEMQMLKPPYSGLRTQFSS